MREIEGSITLRRCAGCGCEFLWPQPSNERLAEEYRGYYEKRGVSRARPKVAFFERMLEGAEVELEGREVLELGSGEGDCIAAINRRWPTARVTAVESNSEATAHYGDLKAELRNVGVDGWLLEGDRREFDVVLAFDLFEHLRDPAASIGRLVERNLKRGGRLIATFPNSDSASRRALGRLWPQYKLEHLFYFSRDSVERIGAMAGLKSLTLRPLAKQLPVDYLLAVGSGFGPEPVQKATRAVRAVFPPALSRVSLKLRFGEWLWVAERT